MSIKERIGEGWELFRLSLSVLRQNHWALIAFPLAGLTAGLAAIGAVLVPFLMRIYPHGLSWHHPHSVLDSPAMRALNKGLQSVSLSTGFLTVVALYFGLMFIAVFFATGLTHMLLRALKGQKVSVLSAFGYCLWRVWVISLFTFVVSLIWTGFMVVHSLVSGIAGRLGTLGSLAGEVVMYGGEASLSLGAAMCLPIMVNEKASPWKALRRAFTVLKATLVQGLSGYIGLGIVFGLLLIAIILFAALIVAVVSIAGHVLSGIVAGVLWAVVGISALAVLYATFSQIYYTALYLRCVEGVIPNPMAEELASRIWVVKQRSEAQPS